jgi:hypothetical protein
VTAIATRTAARASDERLERGRGLMMVTPGQEGSGNERNPALRCYTRDSGGCERMSQNR